MDRPEKFAELRLPAIKRLRYLEFMVWFRGWVSRKDLTTRFGIAEAAATKDFTAYGEAYPKNLSYDVRAKRYVPAKSFSPAFKHDVGHALHVLAGNGNITSSSKTPIVSSDVLSPIYVINNVKIVSAITRSIGLHSEMQCQYYSLSQGLKERNLVPLAIASDGERWHCRAFDRNKEAFQDYTLARFHSISPGDPESGADISIKQDKLWQTFVNLELVPHPSATYPEAIAQSFPMKNGVLRIKVRVALTGYLLRKWPIDVTKSASLPPEAYQLYLSNLETLRHKLKAINANDWVLEKLACAQEEMAEKHRPKS